MNKKLFLAWTVGFLALIVVIYTAISIWSLSSSLNRVDQLVAGLTQSEIESVSQAIRNDLLSGNLNQAVITFSRMRSPDHIAGFVVYKKGQVFFQYPLGTVDRLSPTNSVTEDIAFSEGGEKWGSIAFVVQNAKAEDLKQAIKTKFYEAAGLSVLVILILVLSLIGLSWVVGTRILASFALSTRDGNWVPKPARLFNPERIWFPIVREAFQIGADYKISRDSLEKMKYKEAAYRIVAQVAHDLRAPLGALSISLKRLKSDNQEATDLATKSLARTEDILNEALNTWKSGQPGSEAAPASRAVPRLKPPANLAHDISEVVAEFKTRLPGAKISFLNQSSAQPACLIDSGELKRVLVNIVNNSMQAVGNVAHVELEIALQEAPGFFMIHIADNGPGFSPNALRMALRDGFSEKKDSVDSGTGLGLAYCQCVIAKAGGSVGISNSIGSHGAVVSLCLPRFTADQTHV